MNELEFLVDIFLRNDITDGLKQIIGSRIKILAQKPNYTAPFSTPIVINQPFISTDICDHVYPSPWMATVPPHCTKCGKQAPGLDVMCGTTTTTITTSDMPKESWSCTYPVTIGYDPSYYWVKENLNFGK